MKLKENKIQELLNELDDIIGGDAPLDFLGTGFNGKAAVKEEREWYKRVEALKAKLLEWSKI